jgi:polygalacturonase
MRLVSFLLIGIFWFTGFVFSAELPVLIGDGIADDTLSIQARLNSGKSFIYLPEPEKNYVITKALVIHSNQTLKLDSQTVIRLADNACDYMLTNDRKVSVDGDKNIRVIGGIGDGNNLHQTCPYRQGDRSEGGLTKYMGNAIFLMNIENLYIEGLTIKDPETFGLHLAKVRKFTVKDIILIITWSWSMRMVFILRDRVVRG